MFIIFKFKKLQEEWEVSIKIGWTESIYGMAGEIWDVPVSVGDTGVAKVYDNGKIAVEFDNLYYHPYQDKLKLYDINSEYLNWLTQLK